MKKWKIALNKTKIEYTGQKIGIAKFDLTFNVYESEGSLRDRTGILHGLVKEESAQRILADEVEILEQRAENSQVKISEIEAVTQAERELTAHTFNDTVAENPKDKTVIDGF